MPDQIGNITVPEPPVNGVFPLTIEWGYVRNIPPIVHTHTFGSANRKIEQRYRVGDGFRRIKLTFPQMEESDRIALRDFWQARKGPYEAFTLNYPNEDGSGSTTAITVAFENEPLSWQQLSSLLSTAGVTLVEIPTTTPTYSVTSSVTRFPSGGLATALLQQDQRLIPLVKIQPKEAGYPAIYLSDRRVTIGGQLYVPRLLSVPVVEQSIDGETDSCEIVCGNADRVMRDLAADVMLLDASIEVSDYHVGTQTKIDLWKGVIDAWGGAEATEFTIRGRDVLGDSRTLYPDRLIERQCYKPFRSSLCPYDESGSGGDETKCDKSFSGANGCQAHGMANFFGGIVVTPQAVNITQKSWFGLRSKLLSPTSTVNDSVVGTPLQDIYADADMMVNCAIVAGREEDEFYDALGVVGRGPITGYASDGLKHRLDGQSPHGPLPLGLRRSFGNDQVQDNNPDADSDKFSLGPSYTADRAAGVAFLEIRRTDPKGYQLSRAAEHEMQACVSGGLGGWYWNDPGTRLFGGPMTNPVWIAINTWLRGKRLWSADAATQLATFDVEAAIAAAAICATSVPALVGGGSETQFKFRGVIADVKPLREWIGEILKNCLGYFVTSAGKLKIGVRVNSSAVSAFTAGNIIADSLQPEPIQPAFNGLSVQFADSEFDGKDNSVLLADEDLQKLAGVQNSQMRAMGVFSKSQAARICTVRLREEIGGVGVAEWRKARNVSFKTTMLALETEAGQVVSITDAAMPGGTGEIRIGRWRRNADYSVDVQGKTTTDGMYDLAIGPKPVDVPADGIPAELITDPVPGNVRAIGANAFNYTLSEDGTTATIEVEYDPPSPIGAFTGVSIQIEAPDGSETIVAGGDWEYDGDPNGVGSARYGYATIKAPQPVGAGETWRIYLVSVSRSVRKQLVLHPAANASPNRTVAITEATVGGAAPLPGDVVVGTPSLEYYIAASGERRVFATVPYTAPATPDFHDFNGVQVFSVTPAYDDVTPLDPTGEPPADRGWYPYSGAAGGGGQAVIDMLAPDRSEGWVFYLAAGRDQVLKAQPWPGTGIVSVGAAATLNVTSFDVAAPFYATGRRALIIPFSFTLPSGSSWDVLDWERVEIHVKTSSMGVGDKPVVAAVFDRGTGNPGTAVTSQMEIVDLPDTNETWTFTAVSFRLNGDRHGSSPTDTANVVPPTNAPATAGVTSFSASVVYTTNEAGIQRFRFEGSWVNPTDPDFVGVEITALWSGESKVHMLAIEKEGSASFRTDDWPVQDASQTVIISAYAVNADGIRSTASTVGLTVTPNATGTLKGNRLATATLGPGLQNDGSQLRIPVAGVSASLIADLAITTGKLANLAVDVTKLADLSVEAAKLANSSVTSTKIANAAVGSAAIANAAIGTAHIANAAIVAAHIVDATITSAKIASLDANKINAGIISASVTMTSPTLVITAGAITVNIDSSNYVMIANSTFGDTTRLDGHDVRVYNTFGAREVRVNPSGGNWKNSSSVTVLVLDSFSDYGKIDLRNSGGVSQVTLNSFGGGEAVFKGNVQIDGQLRFTSFFAHGTGDPASVATHKAGVYSAGGSFLGYLYLWP